ncbi:MAG TPA: hypothetical protein VM818_19300 [Vicinamibacterales bacterium]|nr:hypothetical protein [Vicinamibacterales bacterium]
MHKRVIAGGLLTLAALAVIGCGDSDPVSPPVVVNNTPPTIESLALSGTHAEAGQGIQVTASVKDPETPVDQLTYAWSASPANGVFAGSGATVTWTPPFGQATPAVHTVTLTVTERYSSAGQSLQNVVTRSATIPYNDSRAEITAISVQFIKDFGTYSVTPEQCVRNFSNTCPGKEAERDDIENNRENFLIQSAEITPTVVTFDKTGGTGLLEGQCVFIDIPRNGPAAGRRERVTGICHLETVYENFRWYLCVSRFDPPYSTTPLSLRWRVPGRVVFE